MQAVYLYILYDTAVSSYGRFFVDTRVSVMGFLSAFYKTL